MVSTKNFPVKNSLEVATEEGRGRGGGEEGRGRGGEGEGKGREGEGKGRGGEHTFSRARLCCCSEKECCDITERCPKHIPFCRVVSEAVPRLLLVGPAP